MIVNELAKRIVEATDSKVVFTGSFSDTLRGIASDPRDLDIIINSSELDALKEFGDVNTFIGNRALKDFGRAHIPLEDFAIDVFTVEHPLSDFDLEEFDLDGVPIKIRTLEMEISIMKQFVELFPHKFHKEKWGARIERLKSLRN